MSGNWRRSAGSRDSSLLVKLPGQRRIGALVNQINSFAGDASREDISSAFMQPFLAYVTSTHTTISLNTESTYDWKGDDWSVPINPVVAQMLKAGYTDAYSLFGPPAHDSYIPATDQPIRIDYIFASQPLVPHVIGCQIVYEATGAEASDHRPVVAEIEVGEW